MILGHSFVRRLNGDLEQRFDDRAKSNFELKDVNVRLFGVGGRTVNKVKRFDLANVSRFAPDAVILEIGTNDLCCESPETVGFQIDELVQLLLNRFSVRVVGVCQVIRRSDTMFNQRIEVLNRYLSVVLDDPKVLSGDIRFWIHQNTIFSWKMEYT